ncbi:uncharacterized protein LAESUDRAFT_640535 [Laetiporus sulphureus 93-53]|uniref:snRNA-activating protein complex subunit 4 n=1 Tax=Laetiporus sulphureus 93-53 TaxID=1314785 RepID=A0A165IDE2_9APHY|nr:uncharacterized protein LAESUDRAFT_640535 [Laetiporus sulphureus 93-53]KZT12926.1 hypothetical protein LAESUDRAFT_640535 [Laetiporus sulphureus 93-53]
MTSVQEIQDGVQKALQANKDHNYALKVYSERLEAEIETLDKLLAAADVSDNEDELELDAGGIVMIPGSVKTLDLIPSSDLIAEGSPFHEEASRRERYLELTAIHQWKNSELDAIADAVRSENYRIHALEAQTRGQQAFSRPGDVPAGFLEHNMRGIDWERVASKVSAAGSPIVQRSAKECEIRWLGDRHPRFNHSPWAQSEIVRVRELVAGAIEGQVDWTDIAAKLGTRRTPIDCMRHAVIRRTHVWTPESDERLLHAIHMYGVDNWNLVARYVSEDATPPQCQSRYTRSLDPDIKRGPWTEEEDAMLQRCITVFGHSWIDVASFIPGRSNEQCRERYQESVGPTGGKGKWTPEEDEALLRAAEQVKDLSWKAISRLLANGRTDNMCRSRYAILMKRKQCDGTTTPKTAEASASATRSESRASSVFTERSLSVQTPRSFQHVEVTPSSEIFPPSTASETNVPRPRPRPQPRYRQDGVADSTSVDANLVTPAEVPAASPTVLQADGQPAMDMKPSEQRSADGSATATVLKSRASKTTKRQLLDEIADRSTRKRRKKSVKDAEVVTTNSQTSVRVPFTGLL